MTVVHLVLSTLSKRYVYSNLFKQTLSKIMMERLIANQATTFHQADVHQNMVEVTWNAQGHTSFIPVYIQYCTKRIILGPHHPCGLRNHQQRGLLQQDYSTAIQSLKCSTMFLIPALHMTGILELIKDEMITIQAK